MEIFVKPETQTFICENPRHMDSIPGIDYRNRNPADLGSAAENLAAAAVGVLRGTR